MIKLILVVFFIVLIYLCKNYDQIKLWFLNRIILERGILAPSCPWYKLSSIFLKDGTGVNLYNDYKEKHGDFALSKMFNEDIYVVTNITYIKQILDNSPDIFSVGDLKKKFFHSFMSKNVGVSSGCPWKKRREMNERALLTDKLHVYSEKYDHDILHFIKHQWKDKCSLKYKDFVRVGRYMTAKIVFNTNKINKNVFDLFSYANTTDAFYPNFKIDPSILFNYNQFLDKHIKHPNVNSLIYLCSTISSDPEEVKHQIPHFIFPIVGLYITSIPRILILLLNDKPSLKKVLDEIKSVQGHSKDQLLTKKLYELSFLRKCILETLRLMNPLITTFRTLTKDYSFDEKYHFKKNTQFLILNNPVLREKEFFENPNAFNPNRWNKTMEQSYYAISFNQGPQRCPAKELVIFLTQSFIYNMFKVMDVQKIKVKKIDLTNVPQVLNPCEVKIKLN